MNNKVLIILNSDCLVPDWQYKCILKLKNFKLVFLKAKESKNKKIKSFKRNYIKHFIYYLINLISIKQKKIRIKKEKFKNSSSEDIFYNTKSNSWQELSDESINKIISLSPLFIYKCGMNLLHINEKFKDIPIMSHHHGDPSNYRGRPAGFYELIKKETNMGQIVQLITNKLDAGKILAYGETKLYPWSYKKTLREAYKISPIIFEEALKNFKNGSFINKVSKGYNFKLPSNKLGIIFIFKEVLNLIYRIFYGLFYEKIWKVAYSKDFKLSQINKPNEFFNFINSLSNNFKTIKKSRGYDFYADPFILNENIVFEGLNSYSRRGNLLLTDIKSNKIIKNYKFKNKHLSYPYTQEFNGKKYIYPDSGSLNKAIFYSGKKSSALKKSYMQNFKSGLIDPSVIKYNNIFYLFANYPDELNILRLWLSSNPSFNDAAEHSFSPICISPQGGRSGGRIFVFKNKLYRFGQDYSAEYGNGLILFEIKTLNKEFYLEEKISQYKFKENLKGPHTIDYSENLLIWDFYVEKFNFFAGFKRILSKVYSIYK
tara:strand:- start:1071 stop:2696 length:1626 start_codon:yes stop_codon:yes gene_type:complete